MYLKVMTDTCKQTDIDKNVIWRQICAFLAIQLLLMARSPELPALCNHPERDGQAALRAGPASPLALMWLQDFVESFVIHTRAKRD